MADDTDEIKKVLQMYREFGDGKSDFRSLHNPVYAMLSKRLKMKKKTIHKIVCDNLPQLCLKSVSEASCDAKELQIECIVKANLASPIETDANKAVYESMDNETTDVLVSANIGIYNEFVGLSPTERQLQYESENKSKSCSTESPQMQSQLEIDWSSAEVENVYAHFFEKIVIDNVLAKSTADIFKSLGKELKTTQKAAYLKMKRVHERTNARIEESALEENVVENSIENVIEDVIEPPMCMPNTTAFETFSGKFVNEGIFAIEIRSRKHRKATKTKNCVKSGWTSKLAALLFKKVKLSCKFDFKHAWVTSDECIHTRGTCDCGAEVAVSSDLKSINVDITNIKHDYNHTRKYQARGEMKVKLSEMLKHKTALPVQVKIVNELIPNNDELIERFDPMTPTLLALRSLRFRQESTGQDPFLEIVNMKESNYAGVISFISHSPFAVFYQTPLQLALYNAESKKKPMSLSIDATGSLIYPPIKSTKISGTSKLKHVFLYQVMAKSIAGKSVPVAQMISQDQTSEFIEFFLRKTFKDMKQPTEIVSDESKALMKALAAAFGECSSIDSYIKQCTDALLTGAPKPKIQLRIDRSHFVKNISNKIKDRDIRRRDFFRGVIGFLIQCDDFSVVKQITQDFFTVLLNPYDGSDAVGSLPAEISKTKLLQLLTTFNEVDYDSEENDKLDDVELLDDGVTFSWIEEIIREVPIVREVSEDQHANLYFNPGEVGFYTKIFSTITMWSNITNGLFESNRTVATSSDVESNFKTLKTGIIGRRMISPHNFLKIHIDYINATIKLNAGAKKVDPTVGFIRKRSNSLTMTSPTTSRKRSNSNQFEFRGSEASEGENDEEDWRRKNKKPAAVRKPRRSIHSMLNPTVQNAENIMLMKNGHKTYRGKQTFATFNTCPFDSVFVVIAAMYADHDEIKNQINQAAPDSEFLSMIHFMFNENVKMTIKQNNLLRQRNDILCSLFQGEEYECDLVTVDCQANVNYIIPKLLPTELYSYFREKSCGRCGLKNVSKRCFVDIEMDVFETQTIQNLNSCLLDSLMSEKVSKCQCGGTNQIVATGFSNFIIIDFTLRNNNVNWLSLCDVPTELNILGIKFSIKACIEFIPPAEVNGIGHYIAHAYRRNQRWEMYDDKKAHVLRSSTKMKVQGQVLFYVRIH